MDVERWVLDDGRRAEKRVKEVKNSEGEGEKVIELHVEDERPLRLQQVVREKTKPFVFERTVETIDPKTGEIVDQKLESVEPKVSMQLVEHISTVNPVAVQAVDDCDCHVTKEEMIETVIAAIKSVKESQPVEYQGVTTNFSNKLNSLGLVDEIEKKLENTTGDKTLMGIAAILACVLVYVIFFI